jgi:hypothetical protein
LSRWCGLLRIAFVRLIFGENGFDGSFEQARHLEGQRQARVVFFCLDSIDRTIFVI